MTSTSPVEIPNPVGDRFRDKVAVVAGGGRTDDGVAIGVGAATAILLASEGAKVGVLDINSEAADRTVAAIEAAGGTAIALPADVTDHDSCSAAFERVGDEWGTLHALCNTLGLPGGKRGVTEFLDDEWDKLITVNLKGFAVTSRYAIPLMTEGGAIANVSSADAERPCFGNAAFAASKGGVNSLTKHIAVREGYRGIRANAVMPGPIWTPVALGKIGTRFGEDKKALADGERPAVRARRRELTATQTEGTGWDIAYACAFLVSDQARWLTGQILMSDGGASLIAPWDAPNKPTRELPDNTAAFPR